MVMMGMIMSVPVIIVMVMVVIMVLVMNVEIVVLALVLNECSQFLAVDRLVSDLRQLNDVINDFRLEDRPADLDKRLGLLAIEFKHLALLAGKLAGAVDQAVAQLL